MTTQTSSASSEATPKLAAALVKAQSEMHSVGKSGYNTFDKYKYAKLEDYVDVVRPIMAANGLSLACSIHDIDHLDPRPTQKGGDQYPVVVRATFWLEHTSGESAVYDCVGEGQDRGDKGVYKAITGMRKYAIACIFNLVTSDDPERDEPDGSPGASAKTTRPTNHKPKSKSNPTNGAALSKAKAELLADVAKARLGCNSSLSDSQLIAHVVKDSFNKEIMETLEEVAQVRATLLVNHDYDLDTGERLPGDARVTT